MNDFAKRVIVEICCGKDSLMGSKSLQRDGCEVIRITKENDVTTAKGLQIAMEAVKRPNCLLWVAIPCTGGSSWQHINKLKPGGKANLEEHYRVSRRSGGLS